MKRLRDDEVYVNPQSKRPSTGGSSRGELDGLQHGLVGGNDSVGGKGAGGSGNINGDSAGVGNGGAGVAAGSTQKLTTNDALSYLKEVKHMFQDQRDKYDRFLDVMKDFKALRIDTAGVIGRVKELFKGHPNLILGFNTFLPKGYEITLANEAEAPPKRTVEFEEAISFVNKIKNRFQNDDNVYKSFLDILNMYRKEHKGIVEVYREVAELFNGHPDLLDEFTRFLPDNSATASAPHASTGCQSYHRSGERGSALPALRQSYVDERVWRDGNIESNGGRDYSVERPDMNDSNTTTKFHKEQKKVADKDNRDRKNSDRDDRNPDTGETADTSMQKLPEKRKCTRKVEVWGGSSNLASSDDKNSLKSMYSMEFTFCEKVKARLHSADDYQAFLKCLHIYSKEIITRKELQSLVADLLGKYPDLLEGFNEFLERCERIDGFLADVMGKKTLWNEGNSSKVVRIDEKDKESKHEMGGKEKDKHNSKYWGKSIHEIDLSNCQCCTPSYRLLPEDYPISIASQRSEVGAQVLNNQWVSVTSGSEDYSFKHMRRNQYEESLFRCEDDRFELDMLLESVSSAAKETEELLNSFNNNSYDSDSSIRIEDHLTALHLRCIERLYGDHGLDVIDILRKNPSRALPIILVRLRQKQEEWTKSRIDFNKVWAEVYSKNHYKSLDHRSFYFKQQDSKNLSTKALVAEIKEMKEKVENEDDVLNVASGSMHSAAPDLKFEYCDNETHEDVFKIIKYSCKEICATKDQSNNILRFWTRFFEPMLDIHYQISNSRNTNDSGGSECQMIKTDKASIIESESSRTVEVATTNLNQAKANVDSNISCHKVNFCNMDSMVVDPLIKEEPAVTSDDCERLSNIHMAVSSSQDANQGLGTNSSRLSNDPIEEGKVAGPNTEDMLSSEQGGGEASTLNELANEDYQQGCMDVIDPCKNEKEEGELSPNGDFEDNFAVYQSSSVETSPENTGNGGVQSQMESREETRVDAAGENDVDEDSDHISEDGEDVSGSGSAANACSQEEHVEEEEEDGENDLDGKDGSEGEAETTTEDQNIGGDGLPNSESHSDHFSPSCKPLSKHVASPLVGDEKKALRIFYGNDNFYVLFRLHQALYKRLSSAKESMVSVESKRGLKKAASCDPHTRFMSALFSLLDGSSDNAKYEDDCRSLIGNESYVLFTLDKLIYKLVKQLQTISTDEMDCRLIELYEYEKSRKAEKYADSVYYENVHVLLHDENIYRFECTSNPTGLTIQLLDDGSEKSDAVPVSVDPNFASYLHNDYLSVAEENKESSAIMLKRNMGKYGNLGYYPALCLATQNVLIMSGLECKMATSTSKISYVLDTEDFYIRPIHRRRNRSSAETTPSHKHQVRVQRFRQMFTAFM